MESQFMTFWDYFFTDIISLRSIQVIVAIGSIGGVNGGVGTCDTLNNTDKIKQEKNSSFLFYCWQVFHGMDYQTLFKYSLIERHYGCFQVGTITNYAAMNVLVCIQVSVWM